MWRTGTILVMTRFVRWLLTLSSRFDGDPSRIHLLVFPTRAMNGIVTVSRAKESIDMKRFTIDADHNITVFATKKEAAAAAATPFDPFSTLEELAELSAAWPASRWVEIWNRIPGSHAVTKF